MAQPKRISVQVAGFASYARNLVRGVRDWVNEHGSVELMLNMEVNSRHTLASLRQLAKRLPIAGVIAEIWSQRMMQFTKMGIPVVEVTGTWPASEVVSVHADEAAVGRMGAEHLLSLGLKSFAFTGTPTALHSRQRQAAFIATIQEAGYPCAVYDRTPRHLIELAPDEPNFRAWVRSLPKPVGVMAFIDHRAGDVLYACQREGFRIPDDVALIGVGNDELSCESFTPPLTSIDLAPRQIGYRAMEVLNDIIEGGKPPTEHVLVPPAGVVQRVSTQVLPIANRDIIAAVRYIESHLDQPLQVTDLLASVSMSRRALEGHFQRLFGQSPHQYIRRLRMERAKQLLQTTSLSIGQIAQRCGYPSPAAFCNTFQRVVKMSPSEYRQSQS